MRQFHTFFYGHILSPVSVQWVNSFTLYMSRGVKQSDTILNSLKICLDRWPLFTSQIHLFFASK